MFKQMFSKMQKPGQILLVIIIFSLLCLGFQQVYARDLATFVQSGGQNQHQSGQRSGASPNAALLAQVANPPSTPSRSPGQPANPPRETPRPSAPKTTIIIIPPIPQERTQGLTPEKQREATLAHVNAAIAVDITTRRSSGTLSERTGNGWKLQGSVPVYQFGPEGRSQQYIATIDQGSGVISYPLFRTELTPGQWKGQGEQGTIPMYITDGIPMGWNTEGKAAIKLPEVLGHYEVRGPTLEQQFMLRAGFPKAGFTEKLDPSDPKKFIRHAAFKANAPVDLTDIASVVVPGGVIPNYANHPLQNMQLRLQLVGDGFRASVANPNQDISFTFPGIEGADRPAILRPVMQNGIFQRLGITQVEGTTLGEPFELPMQHALVTKSFGKWGEQTVNGVTNPIFIHSGRVEMWVHPGVETARKAILKPIQVGESFINPLTGNPHIFGTKQPDGTYKFGGFSAGLGKGWGAVEIPQAAPTPDQGSFFQPRFQQQWQLPGTRNNPLLQPYLHFIEKMKDIENRV